MACKLVYAFLWQEQVIKIEYFLKSETNEHAPNIMPPLISMFNFLIGFEYVDQDFQKFVGIYPSDLEYCETIPHAKWHEISAGGL